MSTLEVNIDQLKIIKEALEFREAYYRLQANECTKGGIEWINNFSLSVKQILEKVNKCMIRFIRIKYNATKGRYDWMLEEDLPEWRMGLRDLEETKSWLKNEKFINPNIVFIEE
jgi:hypothetical protein